MKVKRKCTSITLGSSSVEMKIYQRESTCNIHEHFSDTKYTIEARVNILIRIEPEEMFAHGQGEWSGEACSLVDCELLSIQMNTTSILL